MVNIDWVLELVLVGLLGVTLVHAIRLERALRNLRSDRAALGEAISGFDSSTRQAELGLSRMQATASEAVQMIGKRVELASSLKDDLVFLTERGEALADRLDALVRAGKAVAPAPLPITDARPSPPPPELQVPGSQIPGSQVKVRSQAERDLLLALRSAQ